MGRLDDRVAIVTGGVAALARRPRCAWRRRRIRRRQRHRRCPADETVALIEQAGGKAIKCVANTVDMAQAEALIQATIDAFGKIDIVVNNAGVTRDKMFHGLDDEQFDFVFNANLKTGFHTTLAAMPYLREVAKEIAENGKVAYNRKIVFTSSVAALMGNRVSTTTPLPRVP